MQTPRRWGQQYIFPRSVCSHLCRSEAATDARMRTLLSIPMGSQSSKRDGDEADPLFFVGSRSGRSILLLVPTSGGVSVRGNVGSDSWLHLFLYFCDAARSCHGHGLFGAAHLSRFWCSKRRLPESSKSAVRWCWVVGQ